MKKSVVGIELYSCSEILIQHREYIVVHGFVFEAGREPADFVLLLDLFCGSPIYIKLEDHELLPVIRENLSRIGAATKM
ncbi:hypothetical protein HUB98_09455 [Paenibacillus barcinonensis]|uniref:Uncharacterized protein n=1 Tax=Paenibacillus barcinonensis TaxID=198119 RepID=A0A2V4VBK4_PAEBA|nr:hypothetical protein [Paenibacillus barcinonensis]PYE49767.1 hypothetical protein DFQ00_105271 [Paenibacillus barcinonensis]QKS56543.1 hypothetical protein HUB98_09455 [Paenibacillus barcinonensis]